MKERIRNNMFQLPFFRGYEDWRCGFQYDNIYTTRTARYEYNEGWVAGGGREVDCERP